MLYYRQKEKGVESNDLKDIQIFKVKSFKPFYKNFLKPQDTNPTASNEIRYLHR